jgi:hypothetical protein
MMRSIGILLFALYGLILTNACAVGQWHASDAWMEQNFLHHKAQFESLLAEVKADAGLQMVGVEDKQFRYANQESIPENVLMDHWTKYKEQLIKLGLTSIFKGDNRVIFRHDNPNMTNGSSQKGYEFNLIAPMRLKTSLDSYRISEKDRDGGKYATYLVHKPIPENPNWYLYLYVD